ncbi:MlaD family protein [Desulfogranum marinum]|uniref:MlaD family protein n=1 Tax=Desulfogranum marinum TaxID=453220 RepID=UPI0019655801|nr:MlaD family protein [Desulfogranum marinum]MBM9511793.1 MCE family protein [Desulfogranum marinum]
MIQDPIQRHKRILSPIWILPFVALCIGSWLLYTSFRDAGIDIHVHFENAEGITPGKTKVIFKGIPIGTVKKIEIDDDMQGVNLIIEMENRSDALLVKDTAFWIVKAEVSAGRISGIETLVSGSYIGTQKGKSTETTTHFQGLEVPPPLDQATPGLRFTLESDTLYSLQRGSHIYTKNLQIGQIEDYALQDNGKILFSAYVQPQFAHLIKNGTRFWNASGLSLTGNLRQGLTVNIESMASLLYGGITCATHDSLQTTSPAATNSHFILYKDFESAEYGIPMTLQLNSGDGIAPGKTEVRYRGLKVGVVKGLTFNHDSFHTVTAHILLDPRAEPILRETTKFWVIKPEVSITGIRNIETLVGGNFITFRVGKGEYLNDFKEEPDPMPNQVMREGTTFRLEASDSGSLERGAPVLFKQLKVGEILDITLSPKNKGVQISLMLYKPYDKLIHAKTIFWNVSGVQIGGSLSHFKVNLASLQTMLAGGIAFISPPVPEGQQAVIPDQNHSFPLYDDFSEAVQANPFLEPPGLHLKISTAEMPPLSVGSPVLYNNIKVGKSLKFTPQPESDEVVIDVLIDKKYAHLVTSTSRFYNLSGIQIRASLQGIDMQAGPIDSVISGGITFFSPGEGAAVTDSHQFQLYKNYHAALHTDDTQITLFLNDATGISLQTKITYQGIVVGTITSIDISPDGKGILATAHIQQDAVKFFRSTSSVWLVQPSITLQGVQNLNTLLSGPYIAVHAGKGPLQTTFRVLNAPPEKIKTLPGLNIVLETARLGSLSKGSPVHYRQIQVGRVTGFSLSPTRQSVWVQVNITPQYEELIYKGTKFWNSSGVQVSGGVFSGLQISTESVEALLKGGISLATPDDESIGIPAQDGDHFKLEATLNEEWLNWQPILPAPVERQTPVPAEKIPKQPIKGQEDQADRYL